MRKLDGKRGKCMIKLLSLIVFTLMLTFSHKHIHTDYLYSIYVLSSVLHKQKFRCVPCVYFRTGVPRFPSLVGFYSCRVCVCKTKLITAPHVCRWRQIGEVGLIRWTPRCSSNTGRVKVIKKVHKQRTQVKWSLCSGSSVLIYEMTEMTRDQWEPEVRSNLLPAAWSNMWSGRRKPCGGT